jgi:hypothetical protein
MWSFPSPRPSMLSFRIRTTCEFLITNPNWYQTQYSRRLVAPPHFTYQRCGLYRSQILHHHPSSWLSQSEYDKPTMELYRTEPSTVKSLDLYSADFWFEARLRHLQFSVLSWFILVLRSKCKNSDSINSPIFIMNQFLACLRSYCILWQ